MNSHGAHMALRGRAISALPSARRWENSEPASSLNGVEYVDESFEPDGGNLYGARVGGTVKDDGLYILTWYGLANRGTQALSVAIDAVIARFPAGLSLAVGDGSFVTIKGNPKPWRTKITNPPDYPGRAVSVIRIPFYVLTVNPT